LEPDDGAPSYATPSPPSGIVETEIPSEAAPERALDAAALKRQRQTDWKRRQAVSIISAVVHVEVKAKLLHSTITS
jgi:hypothetical protein